MKKTLIFLFLLLFFGHFSFLLAEDLEQQTPPNAWVNYLEGKEGIIQGPAGSEVLFQNIIVQEGDKILTNNSVVEVSFGKGNYLRLWKNSEADFVSLEKNITLNVHGEVFLRIFNPEKEFIVNYAGSTSKIAKPGLYRFQKDKNPTISVHEGEAQVEYLEKEETLKKKDTIILGEKFKKEMTPGQKDEFDNFNTRREEELKPVETSHLPEELREYDSTLNLHGKWVHIENTWCWVPDNQDDNWRPYYHGYWRWYPLWGYVWISLDPWGWATHHYGSWFFNYYFGWYWQPGWYWRSAWVCWYWDDYYWGWSPWGWYNHRRGIDYRGWSFITKDQLKKPNRNLNILRKDQLKRDINISASRISQVGPQTSPTIGTVSLKTTKSSLQLQNVQGVRTERTERKIFPKEPATRQKYYPSRITRSSSSLRPSLTSSRGSVSQSRITRQDNAQSRITRQDNRGSEGFLNRFFGGSFGDINSSRSGSISKSSSSNSNRISSFFNPSRSTSSGSITGQSRSGSSSSGPSRSSSSGPSRSSSRSGAIRKK